MGQIGLLYLKVLFSSKNSFWFVFSKFGTLFNLYEMIFSWLIFSLEKSKSLGCMKSKLLLGKDLFILGIKYYFFHLLKYLTIFKLIILKLRQNWNEFLVMWNFKCKKIIWKKPIKFYRLILIEISKSSSNYWHTEVRYQIENPIWHHNIWNGKLYAFFKIAMHNNAYNQSNQ